MCQFSLYAAHSNTKCYTPCNWFDHAQLTQSKTIATSEITFVVCLYTLRELPELQMYVCIVVEYGGRATYGRRDFWRAR